MSLSRQLIPQRWVLSLLEVPDFKTLCEQVKHVPEGEATGGQTHIGLSLIERTIEREKLSNDQLRAYDQNIVAHTRKMNEGRADPIVWKYFQYLALLFTEIYLDHYFRNPQGLVGALNVELLKVDGVRLAAGGGRRGPKPFPPYSLDDLRKIAFYQATGSGKTLQMHANIRQFFHYQKKADRRFFPDIKQTILVTPSDDLSMQHLLEAMQSGFEAEIFSKDSVGTQARLGHALDIISVTKLGDKNGDKTVATEAFEGNNLVLVDEAHRGSGSEAQTWKERIAKLSAEGFSFEYSATFAQAVASAAGARKADMEAEYSKAILFDYSYRYFHGDGFGKDYSIRNLALAKQEPSLTEMEQRELYLTAGLLQFYQQLRIHEDHEPEMRKFQIAKPLFVWVGSSVNAVRKENKREVSDVQDAVDFMSRFTSDPTHAVARIGRLLSNSPALMNQKGVDFFHRAFDYVKQTGVSPADCYRDILKRVFQASTSGKVVVNLLKGCDGELSLQVGDHDPFGVINVGDTKKLHELLEKDEQVHTSEKDIASSLFHQINRKHSSITVLVGSRKFAEGWSSWRVSMMGLLNIGQSEGSMIIQLFGRGVRLQGLGWCLKRSPYSGLPPHERPAFLRYLETLGIYGIRADFMDRFRQFLEEEGVSSDPESTRVVLPTLENLPTDRKLKKLALPQGVSFKRQGRRPTLRREPHAFFKRYPVELNWYPRINQIDSTGPASRAVAAPEAHSLCSEHRAFLDYDSIHRELLDYKALQHWSHLLIPRDAIPGMLSQNDWYRLYLPKDELTVTSVADTARFHEIAVSLLKKYLDRLVDAERADWENERLQISEIGPEDVDREYRFELEPEQDVLKCELEQLAEAIRSGKLDQIDLVGKKISGARVVAWEGLLYAPLLELKGSVLRLSALALRESEVRFVTDLMGFIKSKPPVLDGVQLYLLRNETKTKGIGFFDRGGFYPDFLLWIVRGDHQTVCFIDPHGMVHEKVNSPKIALHKEIKNHQSRLADPNLALESFIVTDTSYLQTQLEGAGWTKPECEAAHVLFMEDGHYVRRLFELAGAQNSPVV